MDDQLSTQNFNGSVISNEYPASYHYHSPFPSSKRSSAFFGRVFGGGRRGSAVSFEMERAIADRDQKIDDLQAVVHSNIAIISKMEDASKG